MQFNVRAGKESLTSIAALSLLSLSGLAWSSATQEQPKKLQEPSKTTQASPTTSQETPQAVTKALSDLRQAIRTELEKSAFLLGKGVDMASLIITTGDQGHAIAGAPASGGTLPGGLGGDRNPPPDPNRPDPNKPGVAGQGQIGQVLDEKQIVGVVMFVGSFRSRGDMTAQPTESSFRGDMSGGTFTVRRASGTSPMVMLVDSNDRTVATVPILGFQDRMGNQPGEASTVPDEMRTSGKEDWGRIYLSILHYFRPGMG
jgi:hypothetical protein